MKSPKADFMLDKPKAQAHDQLAYSSPVVESLNVALLEMVYRQASPEPNTAAQNAYRLDGAKQFVTIWQNLARPDRPAQKLAVGLNYD